MSAAARAQPEDDATKLKKSEESRDAQVAARVGAKVVEALTGPRPSVELKEKTGMDALDFKQGAGHYNAYLQITAPAAVQIGGVNSETDHKAAE